MDKYQQESVRTGKMNYVYCISNFLSFIITNSFRHNISFTYSDLLYTESVMTKKILINTDIRTKLLLVFTVCIECMTVYFIYFIFYIYTL